MNLWSRTSVCVVGLLGAACGQVQGGTSLQLSIAGCTFVADSNVVPYDATDLSIGRTGAGPYGFRAPVSLPDGATITEFQVVGDDPVAGVGQQFTCTLGRVTNTTGIVISTLNSVGSPGTTTLTSGALNHVVDNTTQSYYVNFNGDQNESSSFRLRRVRITYTPPPAAAMCPGDNNGDGMVNGADLSVLLAQFGSVCAP